eukprot:TRINITY_DN24686_c0_g1_i1.p2 TRINITY_DN24686_c0_g1~~TRINITY_DN24686_c0_g1_i1.p2  ORF type:complete len:129 (+),score=49.31 TRINITY_DN24686_c0_g1_i1:173-559(+)
MQRGLVGSEMCIRDRYQRRVHGDSLHAPKEAESFFEFQKETLFQELKKLECTEEQIEGLLKKGIPSPSAIGFLSSRADDEESYYNPVSYTHLTLPTILLVQISVVAVSLKKKKPQNQQLATYPKLHQH